MLTIYLSFSALQSGDQWINETTRIQAAEAHLARKRAEAVAVLSRSETWNSRLAGCGELTVTLLIV